MEINSLLFFSLFCRRLWGVSPLVLRFALVLLGYSFSGFAWWTFDYVIGPSRKSFYPCFGVGDTQWLAPSHTAAIWTPVWWGRPRWSLLLPTFLSPLPGSLPFTLDGHGGTSPGPGSGFSTLREEILTSAFFFFFVNKFALIILNTHSPIIILIYGCQLPSFFSNLCGSLWCGDTGCHVCLPPALLPSLGSLLSSLWICFLSLPIHIPASLFFILQLKLLLQWALKLFWCSACCGNKLSLTPSCTACVLLMEYVVCVCMRFSCKKDCGLQERPGRCSKSRGVFLESSSCNSLRFCFNSVTSWLPTVCADYTDFSKAYILCSPLHVRINKDTWE